MPQIMCPNCGMTINLENRKKIDFNLIKNATKKEPRTFTELLRATKLSRKTLSFRLNELCEKGALVKHAGKYKSNGGSEFESSNTNLVEGFSRVFHDKRVKTGLILIAILIGYSTSGYVLARFFTSPSIKEASQEPVIIGNFTMNLNVNNVTDLYGWQVAIAYNQSDIKILKITQGELNSLPYVLNQTDLKNLLLLGGTLALGPVLGINGSGTLVTITFGYFAENYDSPQIVLDAIFDTFMFNSQKSIMPLENSTLTLTPVK